MVMNGRTDGWMDESRKEGKGKGETETETDGGKEDGDGATTRCKWQMLSQLRAIKVQSSRGRRERRREREGKSPETAECLSRAQ